jgi:tetratricopeptide (TPR) repeat protein
VLPGTAVAADPSTLCALAALMRQFDRGGWGRAIALLELAVALEAHNGGTGDLAPPHPGSTGDCAEAQRHTIRHVGGTVVPGGARAALAGALADAATARKAAGGGPAEVLPLYLRAIAAAPRFAPAHYNMGVAYQEAGLEVEAAQCYRYLPWGVFLKKKLALGGGGGRWVWVVHPFFFFSFFFFSFFFFFFFFLFSHSATRLTATWI